MRIADFNIRATPPQRSKRVREDLELARALRMWVYCWQELGAFRRYKKILVRVFGDRYEHYFRGTRNVISVDMRRKDVRGRESRVLSKAALWIPQPRRIANALLLMDLEDDGLDWVVNFHLTNDKHGRRFFHRLTRKIRMRRWNDEVHGLEMLIDELMEYGYPIWLCADANDKEMPRLHKNQEDLISAAPMHMSVIWPNKRQANDVHARRIPEHKLNTDHAGLVVEEVH